MAKYIIMHKCGHEETHQLFGPHKERERKSSYIAETLCTTCDQAQLAANRAAEAPMIAKINADYALPPLQGSVKQVEWAASIRASKVLEFVELRGRATPVGNKAIDYILSLDSAAFWIDYRKYKAVDILRSMLSVFGLEVRGSGDDYIARLDPATGTITLTWQETVWDRDGYHKIKRSKIVS